MASLLRQIVAGPRSRHPEANLDLCYVTDDIVATSGPSSTYPSLAYRNPLSELVSFLDSRHGDKWCIFEFRAEGCGYPDDLVYGRIWHWPWPDHHPPPFALVPKIMGSMWAWLNKENDDDGNKRVAVVHCKAGKGRSGSMAVSYMISHLGWAKDDALRRFTERRMRPGFGAGVSIPSQLRWINYVERWSSHGGKIYVERRVQVKEVHIWGLKDSVKIAIEGFTEQGKKIKEFHVFTPEERDDIELLAVPSSPLPKSPSRSSLGDVVSDALRRQRTRFSKTSGTQSPVEPPSATSSRTSAASSNENIKTETAAVKTAAAADPTSPTTSTNVVLRPSKPVVLESSDINLAVERRTNAAYKLSTPTSVAHVWFNCYFEGAGPENYKKAADQMDDNQTTVPGSPWSDDSGVFAIDWDAMDGIKGSSRKGIRAFDKVAVVWAVVPDNNDEDGNDNNAQMTSSLAAPSTKPKPLVVPEPKPGEPITPVEAADWRSMPEEEIDHNTSVHPNRGENIPTPNRGAKENDNSSDRIPEQDATADDEGDDDEDGAEGVLRGLQDKSPPTTSAVSEQQ